MGNETVTEEKILQAAMKVFTKKGFTGARMQEIADEAEINKASLHYYFRSKQLLFERIFQSVLSNFLGNVVENLDSDLSIDDKIRFFCENYINLIQKNPGFPNFILNELHQNPQYIFELFNKQKVQQRIKNFIIQYKEEVAKGNYRDIDMKQLITNIISLSIFPFAARPILQFNLDLSNDDFYEFMEERKTHLPEFISNSIKINK